MDDERNQHHRRLGGAKRRSRRCLKFRKSGRLRFSILVCRREHDSVSFIYFLVERLYIKASLVSAELTINRNEEDTGRVFNFVCVRTSFFSFFSSSHAAIEKALRSIIPAQLCTCIFVCAQHKWQFQFVSESLSFVIPRDR